MKFCKSFTVVIAIALGSLNAGKQTFAQVREFGSAYDFRNLRP